jgi:HlyD family secretion protein
MSMPKNLVKWVFWSIALALVAGTVSWTWHLANKPPRVVIAKGPADVADPEDPDAPPPAEPPTVKVISPAKGLLDRIAGLPCSARAFETVNLRPQVSGYLERYAEVAVDGKKKRPLDIGDRVTPGQVLAIIDVPEIKEQFKRNAAAVKLAEARVGQMKAKVGIAEADLEASQAQIDYSIANAKAASAMFVFRTLAHDRIDYLYQLKSIELRYLEEVTEHMEQAREAENAAKAAIVVSKANTKAAARRIDLAKADVREAEEQVKVAQADLDKTQVLLAFSQIVAPFGGVITARNFDRGALIHAEGNKESQAPILTLQRTDLFRAVVEIPDRYVHHANEGDPAEIEFDGLPGKRFDNLKISRIAKAEETATRMMHVEIDVHNTPDNAIRHGMYGKATITLEKLKTLSVPTECLVRSPDGTNRAVFVVRDGNKAFRVPVKLGLTNGVRAEVLEGLSENAQVIFSPPGYLRDGAEVHVNRPEDAEPKADVEQP